MAHIISKIRVTTDALGAFSKVIRYQGMVEAIFVELGDLSTPDIVITAQGPLSTNDVETEIFNEAGIAASGIYRLGAGVIDDPDITFAPMAVMGRLEIAVAGGGNVKSGAIYIMGDR